MGFWLLAFGFWLWLWLKNHHPRSVRELPDRNTCGNTNFRITVARFGGSSFKMRNRPVKQKPMLRKLLTDRVFWKIVNYGRLEFKGAIRLPAQFFPTLFLA